jgi:hypothetical protein
MPVEAPVITTAFMKRSLKQKPPGKPGGLKL